MKCPDCGTRLTEVSISDLDKSFRCFSCGGFWTEPSSVNRITTADLVKIAPVVLDKSSLKFGTETCPSDGTVLERFVGESVPSSVLVKRCKVCGYWWWPTDNLMRFKPAQEAKVNYFKQWGIAADLSALTLPVLVMGILAVGLTVGLYSVTQRQQIVTTADIGINQFSATYLGDGVELVSFRSKTEVKFVEYKRLGSDLWTMTVVEHPGNDVYSIRLYNLEEDQEYVIRVGMKEYRIVTN